MFKLSASEPYNVAFQEGCLDDMFWAHVVFELSVGFEHACKRDAVRGHAFTFGCARRTRRIDRTRWNGEFIGSSCIGWICPKLSEDSEVRRPLVLVVHVNHIPRTCYEKKSGVCRSCNQPCTSYLEVDMR